MTDRELMQKALEALEVLARGGKQLPLKAIVDEALSLGGCDTIKSVIVYKRTGGPLPFICAHR